ncbi:MAG: DUF1638 domain-containing protein [Lentisphaerae bacterium]|nr:DUF1638 domain-containing protein [Lentisphaerota bacterium]
MRLKLIACEVLQRELCSLAAASPHTIDLEFIPKGLHDMKSAEMRERLQARVDAVDAAGYDRILLGYGLCNNGLAGVRARGLPLVLPRSHDCIGLFVGGHRRYREVFDAHPGTYFLTPGWIERGEAQGELRQAGIPHQLGLDLSYDELVREYGEDNAAYIAETLGGGATHYSQMLYIRTGVGPDAVFEPEARARAESRGWRFVSMDGDLTVLRLLVNGPWEEDAFIVVPPGGAIRARADDRVVEAVPPEG